MYNAYNGICTVKWGSVYNEYETMMYTMFMIQWLWNIDVYSGYGKWSSTMIKIW